MIRYSTTPMKGSKAILDPGVAPKSTSDSQGLNDNQKPGQGVASTEDLDAQDQNGTD